MSSIGKVLFNAACKPLLSLFSGKTSSCKKSFQEAIWISNKSGVGILKDIFEKSWTLYFDYIYYISPPVIKMKKT